MMPSRTYALADELLSALAMGAKDNEIVDICRELLLTTKGGRAMLKKGYSKASISKNISTEMHSGKSQAQSVAIAMSVARKAKAKAKKRG